jgi:hypothetical protein
MIAVQTEEMHGSDRSLDTADIVREAMLPQLPNVLHAGSLPDGQFAFNTSWIQAPSVGTAA